MVKEHQMNLMAPIMSPATSYINTFSIFAILYWLIDVYSQQRLQTFGHFSVYSLQNQILSLLSKLRKNGFQFEHFIDNQQEGLSSQFLLSMAGLIFLVFLVASPAGSLSRRRLEHRISQTILYFARFRLIAKFETFPCFV